MMNQFEKRVFFHLVVFYIVIFSNLFVYAETLFLSDSGQTNCYDGSKEIDVPLPSEPFYGQDAQYKGAQPNFTDNQNGTVKDENTGLIWEQSDEQNDFLRTYGEALEYCESLVLGESGDWRLPEFHELAGVTNYSMYAPAVDTGVFPGCKADFYWSATPKSNSLGEFWVVGFGRGDATWKRQENAQYVRCVRNNVLPQPAFLENHDGTVIDEAYGFMWQKDSNHYETNWESALAYCQSLDLGGYKDWRLPNLRTLHSTVDCEHSTPAVFPELISDSGFYWSSTTDVDNPLLASGVDFHYGRMTQLPKTKEGFVRCVRLGEGYGLDPVMDIRINGSNGPISVDPDEEIHITLSWEGNDYGDITAEWWLVAEKNFGIFKVYYSYVFDKDSWFWVEGVEHSLVSKIDAGNTELGPYVISNFGTYNIYFALDIDPDNAPQMTWMDRCTVTVE